MAFLKYVIEMMMALFLGYSKTWVIMCCSKVNFDLATAKIIVTEINVIFYYMHIRVKVLSSSLIIINKKSIAKTQYMYYWNECEIWKYFKTIKWPPECLLKNSWFYSVVKRYTLCSTSFHCGFWPMGSSSCSDLVVNRVQRFN